MAWNNKVIWSEGLFVRTQHFQQHDRYLEHLVEARCAPLIPYNWGVTAVEIDRNMLALGKLVLTACSGIMPDGSPFQIPQEASAPEPLQIEEAVSNQVVYLCLPVRRAGQAETEFNGQGDQMARYIPQEFDVLDNNTGRNQEVRIAVGQLRFRLMMEQQARGDFVCLPLVRIREASPDKGIQLDVDFIASCLDCNAAERIGGYIQELDGLLEHRGNALAERVSNTGQGGVAEISDFLMLQLINRYQPYIRHLAQMERLHPEIFYRCAIQLAGELATFTRQQKRPLQTGAYNHYDLESVLAPLMQELRRSLTLVLEQTAIAIPWEAHKYGVQVANVGDRNLLSDAHFVLAVKADVTPAAIQTQFAAQSKIGPVDYLRQLVNSGLPGIDLRLLPAAPRQIPFHAGNTYFELDTTSKYWKQVQQNGALAIHIAGDFPGIQLELWAVRD